MSGFACECFRCGGGFTVPLPRVFCEPCRPLAAAEAAESLAQYLAEHPELPWPGDRARLRTDEDRAFERDVTTDLAAL